MKVATRGMILCLALLLLLGIGTASAQTDKGNIVIMGTAAFSSSSGDLYGNESQTTFSFGPRGYYFFMDNLGLGGKLGYTHTGHGEISSSNIEVGPDAAYFFKMSSSELLPFVGLGIFLNSASVDVGDNSSSASGVTFCLHGGLAYLIKPNLAIFPELSLNLENRDSNSGTTIMLGVGLAGFLY